MKRLALYTAVVLATILVVAITWQFRLIVFFFIFSVFITAALRPTIDYLASFGLPRGLAQVIFYLLTVALIFLSLYLTSNNLFRDVEQVMRDVQRQYEYFYNVLANGTEMQKQLVSQLPRPTNLMALIPGLQPETRGLLLGITQDVTALISGLVIACILSIYWGIDQVHFERMWLSLLPAESRKPARDTWRTLELQIGGYIRSQFLQSIFVGVVLGIIYWLMGLPYAILLALIASIAKFIPLIGSIVTVALVFLAGLNISLSFALALALITILILYVMRFAIAPYFFRLQQYSSLLIIVLIIPFFEVFGIFGFVLAPPFAVAIHLVLAQLFDLATKPNGSKNTELAALKARLDILKELSARKGAESVPTEVTNLIKRLETLLNDPKLEVP